MLAAPSPPVSGKVIRAGAGVVLQVHVVGQITFAEQELSPAYQLDAVILWASHRVKSGLVVKVDPETSRKGGVFHGGILGEKRAAVKGIPS